ncbi:MAG: hypothetical protein O9283_12315 [Sphingomonadaceae bacterium]|jgi:hypothetical protein|nr:hypothetical protein [Sphingomonadaceae bacterium]
MAEPHCPSTACGGSPPRFGEDPVFTPARKRRFLDELARHGNVRVAAARVGVSRSGVYLARGRDGAFAAAWRAALVLGRDAAVAEVAERALEGWQEPVFYRGQQVALRRRYDSRLLLAHLARLDKACAEMADGGGRGAEVLAADYDALCAALLDGDTGSGANFSSEPCPACPPPLDSAPPSRHSSG